MSSSIVIKPSNPLSGCGEIFAWLKGEECLGLSLTQAHEVLLGPYLKPKAGFLFGTLGVEHILAIN